MTAILHPSTNLGPVSLRISNLAQSVRFYTEVVGLKMLRQHGRVAELTADGKQPLLIVEEVQDLVRPQTRTAGLYHFAILVPDRESLGLALANLIAHNIPVGQGDHLVSEALYINDPDGNGIEIYADRPQDTWKRDAKGEYVMTTDPVDVEGLLALSKDKEWYGLPEGTVIGHVHFHVSSLQDARAFYCDVLGFEVTAHYGDAALFISAGGYHHHIGLNVWAGRGIPNTPRSAAGIEDYSIVLPSHEELEAVTGRIREAGLQLEQRDGVWAVQDPSDIWIRLVVA
ncbi:Glyoxalase/bleomycin resistance protein/dioxygenase [Paenibacillus vortex V453]|jgi:catechol 2,3-dioxygenase|uniref:Glyoxalase/bleomycin resistance protein/dioxygenase n=1 Tax=Paenibacillus vortex V453 TaxID=715225 RepID=A0A2R9SNA6_9BACL|nr:MULTISPECIES: VOC family protein [Paenibacillus]ANA79125.1 glyoxalase [Paenibacillus glucanolyticus]AVV56942.1 glyoxalase [Paenibacillus glucanolyticus]AWP26102.1 glyoxalase [Paenibacillus sp. Cedars]EFU38850.1 Glyoxalase/bleomycin resistance protein/dioxygenase [Paenibacillus vortex V453]ETT39275.1 glyoxalase/bleomycin resistance protein/dioxygenase [Paenibacillus sp. FSL R5-808]